jgi:hypothetical protein
MREREREVTLPVRVSLRPGLVWLTLNLALNTTTTTTNNNNNRDIAQRQVTSHIRVTYIATFRVWRLCATPKRRYLLTLIDIRQKSYCRINFKSEVTFKLKSVQCVLLLSCVVSQGVPQESKCVLGLVRSWRAVCSLDGNVFPPLLCAHSS